MEDAVVSILETTAADGKNYPTKYYDLDAIIAVGYRVNSKKATMFHVWANKILKEYIIKGYVMDDERLKEPENFFYSQCSADYDYDVDSPVTKEFFAPVQDKLHYATTPLHGILQQRSFTTSQMTSA